MDLLVQQKPEVFDLNDEYPAGSGAYKVRDREAWRGTRFARDAQLDTGRLLRGRLLRRRRRGSRRLLCRDRHGADNHGQRGPAGNDAYRG